ncbi:MAG: S41 family peptidase [Bacilli bacterium]|nr:S41 family peptidase [Bacilli bacterium]
MEKKGYSLIHVIIIIVVTSIITGLTTGVIISKSTTSTSGVSYSQLINDEHVQDFLDVYGEIVGDYYENVNKEEMIQNAINGMMEYLDESYTTYLDEDEAGSLMEQLNSKYEGVGITVRNGVIVNVVMNSPAEKAGVLSDDIIESVNGVSVVDKTTEEIVSMIKANAQNVILGVLRDGAPLVFTMKVETLSVPSVSYYMTENASIGYIQLSVFASGLSEEVENAIKKLKEKGATKLIIDVRNNTGGYLDQAYNTASLFLEKGKTVYSLSTKNGSDKVVDKNNKSENMPIVVLVNNSTASAAEILAGALKDSYGASLVGVTTFGKGKVQHTYSLSDGGIVKYTASKWLRPNGTCVDNVGITPDFVVENEFVYDESDPEKVVVTGVIDKQYDKAIELLNS